MTDDQLGDEWDRIQRKTMSEFTYEPTVTLDGEQFDSVCIVEDVWYRMQEGHKTVHGWSAYCVSISGIDRKHFTPETLQDVEMQMRTDEHIRDDLQELADIDTGDWDEQHERRIA